MTSKRLFSGRSLVRYIWRVCGVYPRRGDYNASRCGKRWRLFHRARLDKFLSNAWKYRCDCNAENEIDNRPTNDEGVACDHG